MPAQANKRRLAVPLKNPFELEIVWIVYDAHVSRVSIRKDNAEPSHVLAVIVKALSEAS